MVTAMWEPSMAPSMSQPSSAQMAQSLCHSLQSASGLEIERQFVLQKATT